MLVHKGDQINNVQLITGVRIAEMLQLHNCSVMCTNNGSYCENEIKRERKSQGGGGSGGCVQRMEVIVKKKKRCERRSEAFVIFFFFFFGGGWGGGIGRGGVRSGVGWGWG